MSDMPKQIVSDVFPEERNRLVAWLKNQKRNLRAWLLVLLLAAIIYGGANVVPILQFIAGAPQTVFNWVVLSWFVVIVVLPFLWPEKPGDLFTEDFKKGVNPKRWEWEGNWKTELDEGGRSVLTVTGSELGGIAIPCRSWADYEVEFETRIVNECTAWIVRSTNLNDCVMFQLRPDKIRPHIRANGMWLQPEEIEHKLPLRLSTWYKVRTIVRGSWASVYIVVDGKEHLVYQKSIFAARPPISVYLQAKQEGGAEASNTQVINISLRIGSFGFRLSGNENAQFRNVRAYRLR